MMRTTVTLDPDTEVIVRDIMKSRGVGFKVALNDAIRGRTTPRLDIAFETPTFNLGAPTVPVEQALRLAADLEDDELIAKMRRDS